MVLLLFCSVFYGMERLQLLFKKYLDNIISQEEYTEMWQLLAKEKEDSRLTPELQQLWEQKPQYMLPDKRWDGQIKVLKEIQEPSRNTRYLYRYAAAIAACLLLLAGAGIYFSLFSNKAEIQHVEIKTTTPDDIVPPAAHKATLTLNNGKVIVLEGAGIGSLATEGVANASKINDEKLAFTANATSVEYHTLQVPRGSRPMQLQLADGSQVWLNAASSITFPNIFTGNERVVTMTGEAYFEVAENAAKPFKVVAKDLTVQVLGTHFNVNAYNDEAAISTTLLEGSVKVSDDNQSVIIKPGEQVADVGGNSPLTIRHSPDLDEVMAWKNGYFIFNSLDIEAILRQVSRWYDVDIVYQGKISKETFTGMVSRSSNISNVLKIMEAGGMDFRFEGRKIIVTQ